MYSISILVLLWCYDKQFKSNIGLKINSHVRTHWQKSINMSKGYSKIPYLFLVSCSCRDILFNFFRWSSSFCLASTSCFSGTTPPSSSSSDNESDRIWALILLLGVGQSGDCFLLIFLSFSKAKRLFRLASSAAFFWFVWKHGYMHN